MRTAFAQALLEAAAEDERVWLLCGDLGYSVLEPFAARFPDRFVNVGVAEQNMAGVAAGLAMAGRRVVIYSIANFPVFRCLEQLRVDVCYHGLDVKVVAVGGGLAYGGQGYTHHGVEDLAVMRVLPHMTVLAPADPWEARAATRAMLAREGPCYLRLGKAGEPQLHEEGAHEFVVGQAIRCRDGNAATVVTTGGVLGVALDAADQLALEGVKVRVLSMHTLTPIDRAALLAAAAETGAVVTVEEHGWGGLTDAVATELLLGGASPRFAAVRLPREPVAGAGSQDYLRRKAGVHRESIADAVRSVLR